MPLKIANVGFHRKLPFVPYCSNDRFVPQSAKVGLKP
jgi:hypothetical protein